MIVLTIIISDIMASTSKCRYKQGRRESDIWIHYHEIDEHHVKWKYCTQKSVTRNYKQYLGSLHTASEDAVYTIKLYLDFYEKPSAGQGPAFNYIENVKKSN